MASPSSTPQLIWEEIKRGGARRIERFYNERVPEDLYVGHMYFAIPFPSKSIEILLVVVPETPGRIARVV